MLNLFLEPILHILILIPFILLLLKEKLALNFQRIFAFSICYIVYEIALVLPKISPIFEFIKSSWNWEGKLFGIVWAIIAYFLFRNLFRENDFFTFRQNKKGFKSAIIGAISIVILSITIWFILGKSTFDYETLFFQISLPGIDEEMIFRGILFGLLLSSLKETIPVIGNPATLIISILFGLTHALTLDKSYSINFEPIYFMQTAFAGYVWAWITLKSRSILLSMISHNLSNFFGILVTMIK
ncbi:CPBP family intramembrane glutamic endopeptidase [Bergeyella sp. RCAD1439]|uniref:CPBP family intramembrane glutamic endopeptidase n=1 Tax=Bergeyella anatis TaxID=3113737 RepID=UPI002E18411B|nr:CPBP family intramembrane glutamic endopeptidase [Bergeyella sp. RCAD1439]